MWDEPFFGGAVRLRYLDRRSRDQFADSSSSTSSRGMLTNEAWGKYRSVTLEYAREWEVDDVDGLDRLGFSSSATWAERSISADTYFDDDGTADYRYYNGQSYSESSFDKVTGNLDIPVRLNFALLSQWFNQRLEFGASANLNMPYEGVEDSGSNISADIGGGVMRSHDIYWDASKKATIYVDLIARANLWRWSDDGGLRLDVRVDNVFDSIGNSKASYDNPFVRGRTFWVGASATF